MFSFFENTKDFGWSDNTQRRKKGGGLTQKHKLQIINLILGVLLIFRAAIANKDSPVTSRQNFIVSRLASPFDHQ